MNRRIVDVHVHYDIEDGTALKQFAESSGRNGIVSCLIGGERIGAHDYVPNERILQVCKEFPDIFIPFAKRWISGIRNRIRGKSMNSQKKASAA